VLPQGTAERAGTPVVAYVGPEEGLIVQALVEAEREKGPQVGLSGDEVFRPEIAAGVCPVFPIERVKGVAVGRRL